MNAVEAETRRNGAPARKLPAHGSLWEAFVAAQAAFGPIVKSMFGARSKYAPLDAILDAVRPELNAHGIVVTQPTVIVDDKLLVRTRLVHVSGEACEADYPAGALTLQHQQLGAGVTYARRYSLLSLLGVFPENEDDDGASAGPAGGLPPGRPQQRPITREELAGLQAKIDASGAPIERVCAYLRVGALAELTAPEGLERAHAALDAKLSKEKSS